MKKHILKLYEDAQWCVDNAVEFEFKEIKGKVKLVEGVAAGTAFYGFQFTSGKYVGKTIYCEDANNFQFVYNANEDSDGFTFNNDDKGSGNFIPELNGMTLTLKK